MHKFAFGLTCALLVAAFGIPVSAADGVPAWAYPVNPPGLKPAPDDAASKHVPGSPADFTSTRLRSLSNPAARSPGRVADGRDG